MNGIDVSHGARITLSRSTGENGQKSLSTATGNDVRRQHRPANFNTPQSRSVSCLNTVSTGAQTIQGGQGDTFISTGSAEGTFIGGAGNTLIDARYYRSFQSDYAWNTIGSAFKLDFGWQASSTYRTHAAYDFGYFDPGQTPDTGGLDWLGYVDTAELSDGDRIYVAQPGFGTADITGQDDTDRSYRFDPVNWTLAIDGGTPTAQYEWVAPILAPKKQTLIGGQRDNVLLANDAGNILVGGGGVNVLIGGRGNDRITAGGNASLLGGRPRKCVSGRMLRSTGKNGQKRNLASPWQTDQVANDINGRAAA